MVDFGMYLLKVTLCQSVFYLLYRLFFSRNTFFQWNRYYLLTTLILSFVLPLLSFSFFSQQFPIVEFIEESPYGPFVPDVLPSMINHATSSSNGLFLALFILYMIGGGLAALRVILAIRKIFHVRAHADLISKNTYSVYQTSSLQPFSFYRWIFVPEHVPDVIIEHEKAHVLQHHWIDLMIVELVIVVVWFNPFIYLYRKAIKDQHEYLADSAIASQTQCVEKYLTCLFQHMANRNVFSGTSSFYSHSIKQRILMITKDRTSKSALTFYMLIIPVVCVLSFSFSFTAHETTFTTAAIVAAVGGDEHVPAIPPVDLKQVKKIINYGNRLNPFTNKMVQHEGIDFSLPEGADVVATADGKVLEASYDDTRGNYIIIVHGKEYTTQYFHLKSSAVKAYQTVKAGTVIGEVGNTGLSSGPHLHYEVYQNGKLVDPQKYMKLDGC
jgi:murein DD-endopeptidase MepM/ murein hydrolase activator NlpD